MTPPAPRKRSTTPKAAPDETTPADKANPADTPKPRAATRRPATPKAPAAKATDAKTPAAAATKPSAQAPKPARTTTPRAKRAQAAPPKAPAAAATQPSAEAPKPASTRTSRSKPAQAAPKAPAEHPAEHFIGLHSLRPAPGSRRPRKRVGRGEGSGTGKTSGRGQKGYGSRSGAKDRARFEGGQMPIHMRMRKLRGPHKKQSMPFEPFRTHTQPVNLSDLEARFDGGAEVTLEALRAKGLGTRKAIPVKILASGELSKSLTVHAHAFSRTAQERIEGAGGSCVLLEP